MLTDREVLSTINMLRSEHLDVRTVTMGINLFDCASSDFDTFAYKVRSKIFRYAEKLVETCDLVGDRYGIPVVNKRISVSPIGTVGASFSRDEMVAACRVLDESAKEVGVDFIGGFGALVEKGMTPGEKNLIDALPEALAVTDRICSSINVGSTKAGINMDAVRLMGQRILDVAEATRDRDAIGCAKLVVFCNIPQDVPFMAGTALISFMTSARRPRRFTRRNASRISGSRHRPRSRTTLVDGKSARTRRSVSELRLPMVKMMPQRAVLLISVAASTNRRHNAGFAANSSTR